MELKLNIYDGKTVEKTYTSDDFALMTGTCEDILNMIDIDKLTGGLEDEAAVTEILKVVVKSYATFKNLMKDIFDGLTDDELKHTRVKDVARVVLNVITYTIGELFAVQTEKN